MFVGLFLTYDIITCRMISDFIFRSISYLPVGQSTVSHNDKACYVLQYNVLAYL